VVETAEWVCTKLLLMESGNQSLAGPDTLHAARGRLVEAGSTGAFSSNGMYVPENARVAAQRLLAADPDADDAAIMALAGDMTVVTRARGEALCEQADPSDALFILVSGRAIAVYRDPATGEGRIVGQIAHGEPIGEMGILTGEPRSTGVICWRDARLLRLDRPAFLRLALLSGRER